MTEKYADPPHDYQPAELGGAPIFICSRCEAWVREERLAPDRTQLVGAGYLKPCPFFAMK